MKLKTSRRIYLRLISVSFLYFQSLLHFVESQFSVMPSFLMKLTSFKIRVLRINVGFFLVFCLTPFMADITFITYLLSEIYVYTTSNRLFNVLTEMVK